MQVSTTVTGNDGADHIAGLVACQEANGSCNFTVTPSTFDRGVFSRYLIDKLPHALGGFGLEVSGADFGVDVNSVLGPLAGKRTCQIDDTTFCSGIRRICGAPATDKTIHGGNVDNTAIAVVHHVLCKGSASNGRRC